MRFYKNKQFVMLTRVAGMLKTEEKTVSARIPALREFISAFLERYEELKGLRYWNPNAISIETTNKVVVKRPFAEITLKLLMVLKAANYRSKTKQTEQKSYTLWDLRKLSAEDLCKVYLATEAKMKKIKNLAYYGLSPADLRDARAYYKEFALVKNAPAKRKKDVATKNKKLEEGIKECIEMLEQSIDPLMMLATENDLNMKLNYNAIRKVLPRGQGAMSEAEKAYRRSRLPKKVKEAVKKE